MENTMTTWLKIAFVVAGRVIVALCLGGLLGMLLGVICGGLCGAIFAVMAVNRLEAAYLGLITGAQIGTFVGLISGFTTLLVHSLVFLPVDTGFVKRWRSIVVLMLKMNFIGALAGGLSGVGIGLLYYWAGGASRNTIPVIYIACPSYDAGFFYGSIFGFFGSLLLAALFPEQLEQSFAIWREKRRQLKKTRPCELAANKTQNILKN
jgi:hypothetical protein